MKKKMEKIKLVDPSDFFSREFGTSNGCTYCNKFKICNYILDTEPWYDRDVFKLYDVLDKSICEPLNRGIIYSHLKDSLESFDDLLELLKSFSYFCHWIYRDHVPICFYPGDIHDWDFRWKESNEVDHYSIKLVANAIIGEIESDGKFLLKDPTV